MNTQELQNIIRNGNLELGDVRKLYELMEQNEILSKYNFPTKPSSDGYYHIYVKDPNTVKGRRQIKAKDLEELRQKVYKYEKYNSVNTCKTFADGFKIVQERKTKYIKNQEKLLSVYNTMHRDQAEYKRYFEGTDFELMFIDEISEKDIERFCYLILNKHNIRYKSFLYIRSILKAVFTMAYQERIINENIYMRADFDKFKNMIAPSAPIEERAHSDAELNMMIKYTHEKQVSRPSVIAPYAFELQMLMGLRIGEVTALKWADIKPEGYIFIHTSQVISRNSKSNIKGTSVVNHTKTWKNRKYPVTSEIKEFLDKWRQISDKYYPGSEFIFPKRNNINEPLSSQSVYKFYRSMCIHFNIPLCQNKKKGPHSFRRNAITKVVNNSGGDILMASKLFGNSPQIADTNYYVGLDLELARSVIENGNHR